MSEKSVVTNELSANQADALSKLAYMREAADYAPAHPPAETAAVEALELATAFLSAARC